MTEPDAFQPSPPPESVFAPAKPAAPPPPRDAVPLLVTGALALLALALTRSAGAAPGLNFLLLGVALVASLLGVLRVRHSRAHPAALAVLGLGLACALGLAVRGGDLMNGLNVLGALTAFGLGTAFLRFPGLARLSVGGVLLAGFFSAGRGVSGFPTSLGRFPWHLLRGGAAQRQHGGRVLVGVLFTVPVLLIFGTLLGSADARFGKLLSSLLTWNLGELPLTLLQLLGWLFLLGGPVYAALLARRPMPEVTFSGGPQLGLIELGMPLLSLSVLFCAYLGLQASTFFGSGLNAGLTYAESVRRGFGELSAVAALTLVLLLLAHALLRRELRLGLPYRAISAAVLLPLSLLIVSAYVKLSAYVQAYGLSEIRVLGAVFLGWVTLSLLAFAVLGWQGKLERFAYFSLITGLTLIAGLNVVNPGRLIASVNVNRSLQDDTDGRGQQASFYHLLSLGADAAPVIVANLAHLTAPTATANASMPQASAPTLGQARQALREQFGVAAPDWRSWNLARARARSVVQALGN
ncbi:DUF4153 domain-containing protein [Deinococcus ruber]|uniref:DUF4173 domain-containing protein n=1 Tax=Deinococcus ruber TaxID=1848197 RepID=A0A918CAF6_9DEIO|nr:DUF4173 domain-containing protein [Deinococcus ruber]GGR12531.1 hypothetical protein GCM10008957_26840 [Deinococcus ruber]